MGFRKLRLSKKMMPKKRHMGMLLIVFALLFALWYFFLRGNRDGFEGSATEPSCGSSAVASTTSGTPKCGTFTTSSTCASPCSWDASGSMCNDPSTSPSPSASSSLSSAMSAITGAGNN